MTLRATLSLCLLLASHATAADIKGVSLGMTEGEAKAAVPSFVCRLPLCTCLTYYGGGMAEMNAWIANDERVRRVHVTGSTVYWPPVREGLIAKYGKPSSIENVVVTTVGGAKINSENLYWQFGDETIEASMHIEARKYGVFLTSKAYEAERRRARGPPGKDM